jgi:hypothetical protein
MRRDQQKPGERGGALQIILAIIGALVVLTIVAVWAVRHYVRVEVERSGDTKRVAVRTPIGDIEVQKATEVAGQLGLPIYPGAEAGEEGASVRLQGRLWEEEGGLEVVAAQFRVDAPFDDVDAWYRQQLSPEFKREKGRMIGGRKDRRDDQGWKITIEPGGEDVIFTREQEGRLRGVALGREAGDTTIGLFEITEARHQ